MIKIAVLGYGTVGSGVVEVIEGNRAEICTRVGEEVYVKYILDLRDFPGDPYEDRVVHDFDLILRDEEIRIVCEVMGGLGAAYQFTKQALTAGKSVCTSNKELVAKHGAELLALARENHCSYMFEASVGGGIPIIRTVNSALTADRIKAVAGILNGTTNYILTKMEREGADYEEVLKQAQALGYAERNPDADVMGKDAGRKIAILASLMMEGNVDSDEILTEGILGIDKADFAFARAADMTIKLLGTCERMEDGSVLAMVAPFLLSMGHPLATVSEVFNGIQVTGNMLGDALFVGQGAGKLPTASAVAADVVDCAKHLGKTIRCIWNREPVRLADPMKVERRFFVRIAASGRKDVEEKFAGGSFVALPEHEDELGFFTGTMTEEEFNETCKALEGVVRSRIRLVK